RLVGKRFNQLDLLLCERFHPLARQRDDANGRPLSQQRNAEYRANAASFRGLDEPILRIRQDIGDLNSLAFEQDTPDEGPSLGSERESFDPFKEFGRKPVTSRPMVRSTLGADDTRHLGLAKMGGRLGQRIEYRL